MFDNTAKSDQDHDIAQALGVLSKPAQRVAALLALGFKFDEIANALGVSGQSVRSWVDGKSLSASNEDCLDEFRAIALLLYEELGGDAVRSFFRSLPAPGAKRPLDYLRTDPQAVGAAAMAEIQRQEELAEPNSFPAESDQLGDAAQTILERARDTEVDPIESPAEPELPRLASQAHAEMAYERLDREIRTPNKAAS